MTDIIREKLDDLGFDTIEKFDPEGGIVDRGISMKLSLNESGTNLRYLCKRQNDAAEL